MTQLRRLDPMARATPYQRLAKSPVKSFALTEPQFDRVQERRPELIVMQGDAAVVGFPHRDYLEIHYGFQDVESFQDRFVAMFEAVVAQSSKEEAPRGLVIPFRDRPNRPVAETLFWPLALDECDHWVEMVLTANPERDEPGDEVAGLTLRDITDADYDALADLEAAVTGQPRLTRPAFAGLRADASLLRFVLGPDGKPVAYLSLRTDPGGWSAIEALEVIAERDAELRPALLDWSLAWLRNNRGRRVRRRILVSDTPRLNLLRERGFTPGEAGLDYVRTVDINEARAKIDERAAHGSVIRFGDWR